jgi:uncharacterized membrane protein
VTEQEQKETNRIEAFSDGVFAIAITLLVLELKVPHMSHEDGSNAGLLWALLDLWPSYMALLVSFVTILIMWISHHRLFELIRKTDSVFMMLNGFLLMLVTVVPFPTAILAEYFGHAGSRVACLAYTVIFLWIGIAFNLMWHYAARGNRLLKSSITPAHKRSVSQKYALGPVAYLVAVASVFFDERLSMWIIGVIAVFFAFMSYDDPARKARGGHD